MQKIILLYLSTVPVFFAIDMLWLVFIARELYKNQIGFLMKAQPNWWAAIVFYLLFIAGILFFAVLPALEAKSLQKALLLGALFGFFTYMTYELTNYAVLKDWPFPIVVIDIAWGVFLSASVAVLSFVIGNKWLGF